MKIIESYTKENRCYSKPTVIKPQGLMLHSVGCAQPSASVFVRKFNRSTASKSVHGFIDANSGDFYHTLPYSYKAWHCGGKGNSTHIGVEMCESSCIKYGKGASFTITDNAKAKAHATTAYNSAVELFAKLCKDYSLDPHKAIISHSEGHSKGIASNHGDPEHYWKGLGLSYTMDGFRKDVYNKMHPATSSASPAQASQQAFKVKIIISSLNVRSGAGTSFKAVSLVKKGETFTITKTQGSWGYLKSGAGWINISDKYVKRL